MNKGKLIVVSGPSGVGKDSIVNKYLLTHPNDELSISMTSRKKREGEVDGVNYYFKTKKGFEDSINNGDLLEYTIYNNNYYGTPKSEIEKRIKNGKNVILVIEVEGALNIKKMMGNDSVLIFVMPPSMEELKNRLINRNSTTDTKEEINNRLKIAENEINTRDKYDYIIVNDDLDDTVNKLENIINNI